MTGRTDDLLNVSGHLLSTAEVETALVEHEAVAETAAVSSTHRIKGESIYCFVVLKDGFNYTEELERELKLQGMCDCVSSSLSAGDFDSRSRQTVRRRIGAIAAPEVIHPAPSLPKTRSGKIMRRILRKIARDEISELGDVSTLADDAIIDELIQTRHLYVRDS